METQRCMGRGAHLPGLREGIWEVKQSKGQVPKEFAGEKMSSEKKESRPYDQGRLPR